MKTEIEEILSLEVAKEYEAYFNSNLSSLNPEEEVVIEIKHLSNDWKYTNYKFWMLKEVNNGITDVYLKENTNKLSIIKTSQIKLYLKKSIKRYYVLHGLITQ